MYNCFNIGTIDGKQSVGGIIGKFGAGIDSYIKYMSVIKNTYSLPETLNGIGNITASEVIISKTNVDNIINELNEYLNNSEDEIDKSSWKRWKVDENKCPIFE